MVHLISIECIDPKAPLHAELAFDKDSEEFNVQHWFQLDGIPILS